MARPFSPAGPDFPQPWSIGSTTLGAASIRLSIRTTACPEQIAERLGRRRFQPGIVLEGGAIEGNGAGTLLTTESCLLNPNRNPHLVRDALEQYLRDYLGVSHILWLGRGELAGDDTDGHIDQLARFVNATTVVATAERNRGDANYEPLRDNLKQLGSLCDQDGRRLEVVPLYLPQPKYVEGQRVPASYANFYIANGVVVVPTYDDPADEPALRTLQDLFPAREVVGPPRARHRLGPRHLSLPVAAGTAVGSRSVVVVSSP